MVDYLRLLQRPSIYLLKHPYTEATHKYTKCIPELCEFCVCVCICTFTQGDLRSRMCLCAHLRLYCKQAAERKKHKRLWVKLDPTVSIGGGGKVDCSLQVVWGFNISGSPLSVNTQDKPGFTEVAIW